MQRGLRLAVLTARAQHKIVLKKGHHDKVGYVRTIIGCDTLDEDSVGRSFGAELTRLVVLVYVAWTTTLVIACVECAVDGFSRQQTVL